MDCLASGVPMLLYAQSCFAETDYLSTNKAAFVCTNVHELEVSLSELVLDDKKRQTIVNNALELARINHNKKNNQIKMLEILSHKGS